MAYQEPERQQFHFSSRKGWLNDPNGLCFYQGTYHLFYQHNPAAVHWGPMHWGHATGTDLIHWQEQPIALYPDESGTMFSGCAVVDEQNLTGLGVDPASPPLLFFYRKALHPESRLQPRRRQNRRQIRPQSGGAEPARRRGA